MRFRWKLLLLLLTIALVPVLGMRTFGVELVIHMADNLVARTHDRLLSGAQDRLRSLVDSYAEVIWINREKVEIALAFQAREVENALARAADPGATVRWVRDFDGGSRRPGDLMPSFRHFRVLDSGRMDFLHVSNSSQVFKLAPGTEVDRVIEDADRLARLTPLYRNLSRQFDDLLCWQYTSLENGLHSVFPGHGGIPEGLDPRLQPWYSRGIEQFSWSDPYVDPETRQITLAAARPVRRPDGTIAGVTAFVLPVSRLLNRRLLMRNLPGQTRSFLVYLTANPDHSKPRVRIMARDEHADIRPRNWKAVVRPEWLTSGDEIEFGKMLDDFEIGMSNVRRLPYRGHDSLWVYGQTHPRGFLVLITPYEAILEPARHEEAYVRGQIEHLFRLTRYGILAIMVLVLVLALAFSRTVTRPLRGLVIGARQLARGNFDVRVDIRSRDEFGDVGRVFNSIGPQLKEHYRLRQSLDLAMEVQQNLLPKETPQVPGLDMAGTSLYCDETGGDYYDFFKTDGPSGERLTVLVGDVSDHGIPSALLMTTTRAFLRQRSAMPGRPARIVADVNDQLSRDVKESGQFMTLFYGELDVNTRSFRWVCAGHDPAILYDPSTDTFDELGGRDVPLGAFTGTEFREFCREFSPGQVIVIGTDGIWEAHDRTGEMYGKARLRRMVRKHAGGSAREMIQAVLNDLMRFRHPLELEDDATLVILKRGHVDPAGFSFDNSRGERL